MNGSKYVYSYALSEDDSSIEYIDRLLQFP